MLNEDQKLGRLNQLNCENQPGRLSSTIKSEIYKQLGWIHHILNKKQQKNTQAPQQNQGGSQQIAISCLHKSSSLHPFSGQSFYLKGRCLAEIGDFYQAFQAYRQSLSDIPEAHADTWCSLG